MRKLTLGTFVLLIKENFSEDCSLMDLFELLLSPALLKFRPKSKGGVDFQFTDDNASKLTTRHFPVPAALKKLSTKKGISEMLIEHFRKTILPMLEETAILRIIEKLKALITDDEEITIAEKDSLSHALKLDPPEQALTKILLYVLNVENRLSEYMPATTRKRTSKDITKTGSLEISPIDPAIETHLLLETNGICPNDGCTHSLFVDTGGKAMRNCRFVPITPSEAFNEPNLIALCPECATAYQIAPNEEKISRMRQIKQKLITVTESTQTLMNLPLQENLEQILLKIADAPLIESIPLNYNPISLKNKLLPKSKTLYLKVNPFVCQYYELIHETLRQLDMKGAISSDTLCINIKFAYLKLRDRKLSQPDIFNALVDWISSQTNGNRELCEVIISYFIQKC